MTFQPKKITEIWAWIVTEPDGGEGIPAVSRADGMMLPLLGSDEERIRSLQDAAREIATLKGLPLKLMRFSQAEVLETFDA